MYRSWTSVTVDGDDFVGDYAPLLDQITARVVQLSVAVGTYEDALANLAQNSRPASIGQRPEIELKLLLLCICVVKLQRGEILPVSTQVALTAID